MHQRVQRRLRRSVPWALAAVLSAALAACSGGSPDPAENGEEEEVGPETVGPEEEGADEGSAALVWGSGSWGQVWTQREATN